MYIMYGEGAMKKLRKLPNKVRCVIGLLVTFGGGALIGLTTGDDGLPLMLPLALFLLRIWPEE